MPFSVGVVSSSCCCSLEALDALSIGVEHAVLLVLLHQPDEVPVRERSHSDAAANHEAAECEHDEGRGGARGREPVRGEGDAVAVQVGQHAL